MSGEALTFVEIDIPYCALTYGVAPCQASLTNSPPTGTDKCFNSLITCQDIANYDPQTVTLRFAVATSYLPRDIDIVASSVLSVEYSPAIVSLGENLGQRASIEVVFKDHPHSDAGQGFDKYHSERTYNPFLQGSLWGKFRARQPFLRGLALRWITGFVGDTLAEMETRHFFIDSFTGPRPDGKFSIIAKDALKFLDGDRAQAPVLSTGFLNADITNIATAATLSPAGIGNSEYPASGFVCIGGNEVCSFTRIADALTLTRAQRGTIASAHSAQDRVQLCITEDAQDPADILHRWITNYTDLDAAYITLATWQAETDANLNRVFTFTITEPTPVKELVSRLIVQAGLALWDDNVAQQLRLQVLRAIPTTADRFTESNIMRGSFQQTEQPEKRVTQVYVYFGQIDPTKRYDDPDNYRASARWPEPPDEETGEGIAIKKIFANGIPGTGGRTIAERIAAIQEGRYRTAPRRWSFNLMRGSVTAPVLGGGYQLSWNTLQDAFGAMEDQPIQIIRLNSPSAVFNVEAEEMRFTAATDDPLVFPIVFDTNSNSIDLRDVFNSLYGSSAAVSGITVNATIQAGVLIGSTSVSIPAFDIGDWPAGITRNLIVIGRIQGHGGNGGTYPGAGLVGAPALYTRVSINLTDTSGEVWGGGGGGGAMTVTFNQLGGGGGAGQLPGQGGGGTAPGFAGTTEVGGVGGTVGAFTAGSGGGPGLSGTSVHTAGGAAGASIDGISFVTTIGGAGDRRGGTIN